MPVSNRRRTCAATWCTLFVGLLLVYYASAIEKNDNDDSNNLGLLTSACADNFCRSGVSGLDLWLSLEEVRANKPSLPIFWAFFACGYQHTPLTGRGVGWVPSTRLPGEM